MNSGFTLAHDIQLLLSRLSSRFYTTIVLMFVRMKSVDGNCFKMTGRKRRRREKEKFKSASRESCRSSLFPYFDKCVCRSTLMASM